VESVSIRAVNKQPEVLTSNWLLIQTTVTAQKHNISRAGKD